MKMMKKNLKEKKKPRKNLGDRAVCLRLAHADGPGFGTEHTPRGGHDEECLAT